MNESQLEQIRNHPSFKEMERKKSNLGTAFSILTLVVYFSYIIAVGVNPGLFATPVADGKVTTLGIYFGVFIIIFAFVVTAIYIYKANGEFDDLTKKVIADLNLTAEKPAVVTNAH